MTDRHKRQPTGDARSGVQGAIAALNAARHGRTKRAIDYEVKLETNVYDVLDEKDYLEVIAKRKAEEGAEVGALACRKTCELCYV